MSAPGISRKTGYKWLKRYQAGQTSALAERSRAPHSNARAISPAFRQEVIAARMRFPYWGPKKIRLFLISQYPQQLWPAPSSIGELLKREGLVKPRRRRNKPQKKYQHAA